MGCESDLGKHRGGYSKLEGPRGLLEEEMVELRPRWQELTMPRTCLLLFAQSIACTWRKCAYLTLLPASILYAFSQIQLKCHSFPESLVWAALVHIWVSSLALDLHICQAKMAQWGFESLEAEFGLQGIYSGSTFVNRGWRKQDWSMGTIWGVM